MPNRRGGQYQIGDREQIQAQRDRARCAIGKCFRYRRYAGAYEVWHNEQPIAKIDRTGDDDGWLVNWWWTWVDGRGGFLTAKTLRAVKALGEDAVHRRST